MLRYSLGTGVTVAGRPDSRVAAGRSRARCDIGERDGQARLPRGPPADTVRARGRLLRAGLQEELAGQTFVGGKRVVKQELPELPNRADTTVHVVKVNLHGAKPPVWRRLEIPSAMTLDLMHEVLQAAFDWC
jgi:hypothetical protein